MLSNYLFSKNYYRVELIEAEDGRNQSEIKKSIEREKYETELDKLRLFLGRIVTSDACANFS
jgi:hypothetical protein